MFTKQTQRAHQGNRLLCASSLSDHGRAGAADGRPAQQMVPVPRGSRQRARDPRLHRPQQALPLLQRSVVLAAHPPTHLAMEGKSMESPGWYGCVWPARGFAVLSEWDQMPLKEPQEFTAGRIPGS